MPELIYKVKFEIDSSLDTISSVVDPNSLKEVQDLKKSFSDLQNKHKELQDSFKSGGGSGGGTGGASSGFLDLMQNVKTTTSEVRKNTSTFKKSIVTTDQSTDSFVNQSEALLDGSIQLQRLREELEEAAQQENLTDKQTEQLNNTINNLANVQRSAVSASNNFNDGLQVLEHQSGTMNKAFAGSNQLLFSFSDLVQDSTQFSMGFSQGMRAIGNNVGFTAELFANLSNNVKRHNKLVADGTLKNESQITTFQALKRSIKGAGGALIAINTLVAVSTALFTLLDKRVKKAKESAKTFGEAFLEVNKEFAKIDTGSPDPLGFRAREREIDLLTTKVEELTEGFKQNIVQAGALANTGTALGGALAFIGLFDGASEAVVDYAGALNIVDEKQARFINQNEFLREKLKELIEQQTAYAVILAQPANKALSDFIDLTKDYERVLADQLGGVDLTNKSLDSMAKETERQIDALRSKTDLTDQEIGVLFQLLEVQESINAAKQKEIDLMLKREKIAMDTASINAQTEAIRSEIDILKTRDERRKISIASQEREKDITKKLASDLFSAKSAFLNKEMNESEFVARVTALNTKAQADSDLNAIQTKFELQDLTKESVLFGLDVAKNFTSSFTALKGQEIDAEIKAAKARGASAKEIERLQRKKFKQEKAAQLASAVINTAAAVAESLPNVGKSVAVGALGAVQIATILATKFGGGAPSGGVGGGAGGGAAQGLFATTGGERQTRINRPLFGDQQSAFVPRAQGGSQRFAITVNNTFDEQTAASVVADGNEQRREGAISAT